MKTTEVPYAADAEQSLSYDELEVLRIQYEKEIGQQHVTIQSKFNYAWGLVKSPRREHQTLGVKLFQELYKAEPSRRRECVYYLALGYFKLGNYDEAKRFNGLLLEKEPNNLQARSLADLIEDKITQEGYIGIALAGAAAAIGTIIVAGLVRRAHRT